MKTWPVATLGLALLVSFVFAGEVEIVSLVLFYDQNKILTHDGRRRKRKTGSNVTECTARPHGAETLIHLSKPNS